MKVTTIFNKTVKKTRVTIESEQSLRTGDYYIVKVYKLDKRGETLVEEVSFHSQLAAEKFAEMELKQ